jgi:transcription elongation GreA/GreB family factor
MPRLSKDKITELQKSLEELTKSLNSDNELITKMGGPMDSFKETASYSVTTKAKEVKLQELQNILNDIEILEDEIEGNFIVLGKWFIIENAGERKRYRLVDPIEAEPRKNLISYLSPLGIILLNKKVGDHSELNGRVYEILEIE